MVKFTLPLVQTLRTDKKRVGVLFFSFLFFLSLGRVCRVLSRGVRGAARDTRVRVSDEGDSLDDLLPRALNPRVFARLGHSVRVLCSQECVLFQML